MIQEKKHVACFTVLAETSPQALPLGAACIASAIKNDLHTKDKFIVDLVCYSNEDKKLSYKDIAYSLKEFFAVCFSIYVWNRDILTRIAIEIKKLNPSIICIAGGPEATANPESFIDFDYSIAGEGEYSVPLLLSALLSGGNIKENKDAPYGLKLGIQGIYVPSNKNHKTILRSIPQNESFLASPYLDGTLNCNKYGGALWELARGCPFKCSYCYESKGESKIRYLPIERLKKELELFKKQNVSQIFVLDPTYNADKKRALSMLRLIKQKAPDIFFYFEVRAEFIDKELAFAFASIPCSLQIGLQSIHQNVLENIHRSFNKKLFEKNIALLNKSGAIFGFDLIYGLPGDSLNGFKESIDFAISLYPNNIELFCLSVLSGTTLYENASSFGLVWQNNPPYNVIKSPTFPERDIQEASNLAKAVNIFYTQGMAVPWFCAILKPLKQKASDFFTHFVPFIKKDLYTLEEIEALQIEYVCILYKQKHIERYLPVVQDLIVLNSAIGRCTAQGKESIVKLHYHPDDIMSGYAYDIQFFLKNAKSLACRVHVFYNAGQVDYKKI